MLILFQLLSCLEEHLTPAPGSCQIAPVQPTNLAKNQKYNIPNFSIATKQCVVLFQSEDNMEATVSLASINATLVNMGSEIYGNLCLDSFVISTVLNNNIKVLLNPWSCNVNVNLLYETWLSSEAILQTQIQAESNGIYLDLGPKQIHIIQTIAGEIGELTKRILPPTKIASNGKRADSPVMEQHYTDDLKSGAFQFVNGSEEEFPFPYQVILRKDQGQKWLKIQVEVYLKISVKH